MYFLGYMYGHVFGLMRSIGCSWVILFGEINCITVMEIAMLCYVGHLGSNRCTRIVVYMYD